MNRYRSVLSLRSLLIAGLAILTQGCVTATVQEVREGSTSINEGDAVVVLGRRDRPAQNETELDFISCVSRGVGGGASGLTVIEEQAFRDALFPWFEPRTAPVNTRDLPEIIHNEKLAARLDQIGVKYLIWVEGSTRRTDAAGSMSCTASPAGAGCFGFLTWENDSDYEASIWDVANGTTVGRVSSEAVGTSYMPAVIVPVPIIARVKASACNSLADQLKGFFTEAS